VSTSGYYNWLGRPEPPRELRNKELTKIIRQIHTDSRGSYGSPRVHAELTLGLGEKVNRKRVERLMRAAGMQGVYRRKGRRQDTDLVVNALSMAVARRKPDARSTILHSDHGTQYTPWAFGKRLRDAGLLGSMGTVGDCYDNAMMESFWETMQLELLDARIWKT
jgi:putative transposase